MPTSGLNHLTNIAIISAGLVVSIYSWIHEVQRSLHALFTNETETRGQLVGFA